MCWKLPTDVVNAAVYGVVNLKAAVELPRGLASVHPFRMAWVLNLFLNRHLLECRQKSLKMHR